MVGKGDRRRPKDIKYKQYNLNYMLAIGKITLKVYKSKTKELKDDNISR